jgi:glycosyltransferase involved in cell wall biosynthesis
MSLNGKSTLYICYFGAREPLVRTQVLPYLREIAKAGVRVHLVTFEPDLNANWTKEQIESERQRTLADGISWECLAYHKRFSVLATAYDVLAGTLFIRRKIAAENLDVLHGRIHVATLIGALARKLSTRKPKLLFDIRGFFPEEYTDAGVWPENGLLYRTVKRVERWLMSESDGYVVLTEKARTLLFGDTAETNKPVEVIPCCVDFRKRFTSDAKSSRSEEVAAKLGTKGRFVITHVGALGGLYLTEELVDFVTVARELDPSVFALFLTQSDPKQVTGLLRKNGFGEDDFFVGRVSPEAIPAYLSISNIGLSFVKATYATQSRSPTKIPEYLAAGLPLVANAGVGDVDQLIHDEGVGVLIGDFNRESYVRALQELAALGDIGEKCRNAAVRRFDLGTVGGERYRRLYTRLLQ